MVLLALELLFGAFLDYRDTAGKNQERSFKMRLLEKDFFAML